MNAKRTLIVHAREDHTFLLPQWQHGLRCHGYWLRDSRVGYVGLTPRVHRPVEYTWGLDAVPEVGGTCKSLRGAKRCVERAFRANYSWRFPANRGF